MYAVFQVGKHQYQVAEGDMVRLENVTADVGQKVRFDQVLFVKEGETTTRIGQPFLKDICVETEVVKHYRGQKILVFNYKRRKGYHKQKGHRQGYTSLKVVHIGAAKEI